MTKRSFLRQRKWSKNCREPQDAVTSTAEDSGRKLLTSKLHTEDEDSISYSAGLGLLVLSVAPFYALSIPHSIRGGDSGEIAGAICEATVPHPPGYPLLTILYTILYRPLHSALPNTSPAFLLNSISTLFGIVALLLLYDGAFCLSRNALASLIASVAFAFMPTVWCYSTHVEVFALHNLLMALLLRVSITYFDNPRRGLTRFIVVCAGVSGVCLSNQHTSLLFIVPMALAAFFSDSWFRSVVGLLSAALALVIGLLPYALLPALSVPTPRKNSWGIQGSMAGLIRHVLRSDYGTFQLTAAGSSAEAKHGSFSHLSNLRSGVWLYIKHVCREATTPIALAGACGLLLLQLRHRPTGIVLGISFLFYVVVFHSLANIAAQGIYAGVLARFWQQPNMIICLAAAVAITYMMHVMSNVIIRKMLIGIFFLSCSLQLLLFWPETFATSTSKAVDSYGRSILRSAPQDTLLLVSGDMNNNVVRYLQQCERMRPDVDVVNIDLLTFEWFVEAQASHFSNVVFPGVVYHPTHPRGFVAHDLVSFNYGQHPIVLCGSFPVQDRSHERAFKAVSFGLCKRLFRHSELLPSQFFDEGAKALPSLPPFQASLFTDWSWERVVYVDSLKSAASMFYECSMIEGTTDVSAEGKTPTNPTELRQCVALADVVMRTNTELLDVFTPPAGVYYNAGVVYGVYSLIERRLGSRMVLAFERALTLDSSILDDNLKNIVHTRYNPFRHEPS